MYKKFLVLFLVALTLTTKVTPMIPVAIAGGIVTGAKILYDYRYYTQQAELSVQQAKLYQTPLHTARGEAEVNEFIRQGIPVNAQNVHGQTALHIAAMSGHEITLKALLKNDAAVDIPDYQGNTALNLACSSVSDSCWNFWHECIIALVAANANVNIANIIGKTPLHFVVKKGNFNYYLRFAEILINHGADVNSADHEGVTPLHSAVGKSCVELLLAHGADIHATTNSGKTALHCAAERSFPMTMKTLLEHGAQVNAVNNMGETPLDCALLTQQKAISQKENAGRLKELSDCINILLYHGATTGAHIASKIEASALQLAHNLAHAPSYNQESLQGFFNQAGHRAAASKQPSDKEREKESGKEEAEKEETTEHTTFLSEPCFLQHAQEDSMGMTPLHYAALHGDIESVRELIKHTSNVDVLNDYHMTPLHFAIYENHPACVKELVLVGHANVNSADDQGLTPLHYAVIKKDVDCILFLLRSCHEINLDSQDANNDTPLDFALKNGYEECAKAIIEHLEQKRTIEECTQSFADHVNIASSSGSSK